MVVLQLLLLHILKLSLDSPYSLWIQDALRNTRKLGDSSLFNIADTHPNFGYVLQENINWWAVRVSNPRPGDLELKICNDLTL